MKPMKSSHRLEYISTREAAALLGVALSTVQLWVEAGTLPAWKTAGGHRRIPRAAVDDMLSQQQSMLQPSLVQVEQFKILVVEDDPVQLGLYRQKLTDWHLPIKLLTANDGFEGLIMVGRHTPNLIITDLRMPGMDGFRLIRQLSEQTPETPCDILVVTGLNADEIEAAGELLPEIPIYSKPIPFAALRVLIESKLQRFYRKISS